MSGKAKRISVSLPEGLLKDFERMAAGKAYYSRSKAIADALRGHLAGQELATGKKECIGTILVLYDHTTRGLAEKIIERQHSSHSSIISNTHLHLDKKNCLEIIMVKAFPKKISGLAAKLQTLKGVKQVKTATISP
jgi:CopG family nickel-responsive transcriptional regulator